MCLIECDREASTERWPRPEQNCCAHLLTELIIYFLTHSLVYSLIYLLTYFYLLTYVLTFYMEQSPS